MHDTRQELGRRIVEAARLATLMHLSESHLVENLRQREDAGGAGEAFSKDGVLNEGRDGDKPSRIAREEAA